MKFWPTFEIEVNGEWEDRFLWSGVWNWYVLTPLIRIGVLRLKEDGGWFRDVRVSPLRYWFRGFAPLWGEE